jgi:hypothetical protein
MAITYSLEIATELGPPQIIELLSVALGLAKLSTDELDAPGVLVRAVDSGKLGREITEEAYHVAPRVSLIFRMLKFVDLQFDASLSMLRICSALLETMPSDMLLLFNGERPCFLRVGGQLSLCNTDGFWRSSLLECIRVPYTMADIPPL